MWVFLSFDSRGSPLLSVTEVIFIFREKEDKRVPHLDYVFLAPDRVRTGRTTPGPPRECRLSFGCPWTPTLTYRHTDVHASGHKIHVEETLSFGRGFQPLTVDLNGTEHTGTRILRRTLPEDHIDLPTT